MSASRAAWSTGSYPRRRPSSLDRAASLLGLRDEAAVHAEAFVQWVIEDDFAAGRPSWEVGGGGTGPGRPALSGAEAAAAQWRPLRHRLSRRPARQAIRCRRHGRSRPCRLRRAADAGGHCTPDPGARGLRGRSLCPGAPAIASPIGSLQHRTLQIAMDGSQKIPVRWLPVLREARRRGVTGPASRRGARRLGSASSSRPGRGRPGAAARRPAGRAPARRRDARRRRSGRPGPGGAGGRGGVRSSTCDAMRALVEELTTVLARIARAGARAALSADGLLPSSPRRSSHERTQGRDPQDGSSSLSC